jgi:hypothetical protein
VLLLLLLLLLLVLQYAAAGRCCSPWLLTLDGSAAAVEGMRAGAGLGCCYPSHCFLDD